MQRLCPFFQQIGVQGSCLSRCVEGNHRHENAYRRKTSRATQPLERQEFQAHPFCAAGVGAEATNVWELDVKPPGTIFSETPLARARETITVADPDSRIASSMVEQVTLNH